MASYDKRAIPLVRKPRGGYRLISVRQICIAWSAYQAGLISLLSFRVYLALHEVAERRHAAAAVRSRHSLDTMPVRTGSDLIPELQRLVRCSRPAQVRRAMNQLSAAGLVTATVDSCPLAVPDGKVPAELHDRARVMEGVLHRNGRVPLPRHVLRELAQGCSAATAATMLGTAIRCLYLHRKGLCSTDGSCSVQLLAHAFGLHPRSIKAARKQLRLNRWLRLLPADRWHVQRFGARCRINMAWSRPDTRLSPRRRRIRTETPPPIVKQKLPTGQETREPHVVLGRSRRTPALPAPTLRRIVPADLVDSHRLLSLFEQSVDLGHLSNCPADRLRFFAAAEHALRVGNRNPCGLFAQLVRQRLWRFSTQRDEDRARPRLRRLAKGSQPQDEATRSVNEQLHRLVRDVANRRCWPHPGVHTMGCSQEARRTAGVIRRPAPVLPIVQASLLRRTTLHVRRCRPPCDLSLPVTYPPEAA